MDAFAYYEVIVQMIHTSLIVSENGLLRIKIVRPAFRQKGNAHPYGWP